MRAPGIVDRPARRIDDGSKAAVACARRRQLHELGAAEIEVRYRLAAGHEDDGQPVALEAVGDGGGPAQMADAQQMLDVEEDAGPGHAGVPTAMSDRKGMFSLSIRSSVRSTTNA